MSNERVECPCGEPVPIRNREDHLRRHAEWERRSTGHTAAVSKMETVDVTSILIRLDQQAVAIRELARAVGIEVILPPPTLGEQGWLASNARVRREADPT